MEKKITPAESLRRNRNDNGRPPLPVMEKKSYRITVKLNPTEYYMLKGKALKAGMSRSEIARQALQDSTIKERLKPEHASLIRELTAMGNNLNQLTKKAHQVGFSRIGLEVEIMMKRMDNIIKNIAE